MISWFGNRLLKAIYAIWTGIYFILIFLLLKKKVNWAIKEPESLRRIGIGTGTVKFNPYCQQCAQWGVQKLHLCTAQTHTHTNITGNFSSQSEKHQITRTSGLLLSAQFRDNACLLQRQVSVFLNKQADTQRCWQGLISCQSALENVTEIYVKYAFLYSSPRKSWSLLWLFDCHLCKYSFLVSCCFIFISLGVGGKVLHENAFLSHLWLHFECHRFLRIDRIICTHHFADAKKELWTLGTFLGVFASF